MTDMKSKKGPPRRVRVLSAEAEAFLSAITASGNFTLEAVLARYPGGTPTAEVMQALKEASVARNVTDTNTAAKDGELQPITPEQYAVLEKAAPEVHGKGHKLHPRHTAECTTR